MKNNYKLLLILFFAFDSLKAFAACTPPSSSAGTPVITCPGGPNMTLTWTAAGTPNDCNGYVVIRRTTSAGTFSLTAGTALPTAGTTVTFGGQMNCYIEYVGPNLTTTSNVSADIQYYYYVIPYNNAISACSPAPAYKTSSVATVTNTRTAPGAVSNFSNGTPTTTTIPDISFSPPPGGADGYLVCTNPNGYYSRPTNLQVYNVGDKFNNGSGAPWDQTVQYVGPATSGITAATGLVPGQKYSIIVYPYRSKYTCSGGPVYQGTIATTTKDNITMALNVGLDENANASDASVLVYPNPATKELRILSSAVKVERADIYNVLGESVMSIPAPASAAGSQITIDISRLSKGIYFVQLKTVTGVVAKRFVKE